MIYTIDPKILQNYVTMLGWNNEDIQLAILIGLSISFVFDINCDICFSLVK